MNQSTSQQPLQPSPKSKQEQGLIWVAVAVFTLLLVLGYTLTRFQGAIQVLGR